MLSVLIIRPTSMYVQKNLGHVIVEYDPFVKNFISFFCR